jgi:hypothetical protein
MKEYQIVRPGESAAAGHTVTIEADYATVGHSGNLELYVNGFLWLSLPHGEWRSVRRLKEEE